VPSPEKKPIQIRDRIGLLKASREYLRRRRLAMMLGVTSVACLIAGIIFGIYLETFYRPSLIVEDGGATVLHGAEKAQDSSEPGFSYILELNEDLSIRSRSLVTELLLAKIGPRLIYRRHIAERKGDHVMLDQDWDVLDAVPGPEPGSIWCFGVKDAEVLLRRVVGNTVLPQEKVGVAGGEVHSLKTFLLEDGTPAVAWLQKEPLGVRVMVRRDGAFAPRGEFKVERPGDIAPVASGGNILIFFRGDRSLRKLLLRVVSIDEAGAVSPPRDVQFPDPTWIGRRITGVDAARSGDGILMAITRATSLQMARLTAEGDPAGPLASVAVQPAIYKVASFLWPTLMLFFSFSLVFLGFSLLRDRRRILLQHLGRVPVRKAPPYAEITQRIMAHILDLMLLLSVWLMSIETFGLGPREGVFSLSGWLVVIGLWEGLLFVYHFIPEWIWGQTLGKHFIGIRVTRADGARLGFRGALVRNLVRLVDGSFFLCVIGLGCIVFTRKRQRPGDMLGGTVVMDLAADEPQEAAPLLEGIFNPFREKREGNKEEDE
jgi:uncharacterized RDD family membrane protein YckC